MSWCQCQCWDLGDEQPVFETDAVSVNLKILVIIVNLRTIYPILKYFNFILPLHYKVDYILVYIPKIHNQSFIKIHANFLNIFL